MCGTPQMYIGAFLTFIMYFAYMIVAITMFAKYMKQKGIDTICERVVISAIGATGIAYLPFVIDTLSSMFFGASPINGLLELNTIIVEFFWWGN
jgi:hypothetical protein